MIKYYNTEAEYQAAVKSAFESEVSLIGANNAVKFDGRNVVVDVRAALTGSVVVLDGNSAMHFIARGTYNSSSFMSQFTILGVVAVGIDHPDYRGQIVVAHKTDASRVWSYIYSYRLTGYTLDGTDRTGTLNVYQADDNWAARHAYTISYNATTVEDFVAQLNTYFLANAPFTTQDYLAQADDQGNVDILFHFVSSNQRSNTGSAGFTLTANLLPEITASSAMLRKNGQRSGEGSILNMARSLAYYRNDNGNQVYQGGRTSDQGSNVKQTYPINLPTWLGTSTKNPGDFCAGLRAIYGEGEAGWLKFMETMRVVQPTMYGPLGDKATYGDGKTNTYKLAGRTFTRQNGEVVAAFPAADFCASIGYNHELARKGMWMLPDIDTLASIIKEIKYNTTNNRNADPVNAALYAIGGSAISNGAFSWSSSGCGAYNAWCFHGNVGYASNYSMYHANRALPVLLLDVRDILGANA